MQKNPVVILFIFSLIVFYTIINYDNKLNTFTEIPTCVRLALISTLEIITILNNEIMKIQMKIQKRRHVTLNLRKRGKRTSQRRKNE